jgi:hypothetical protein
MTEMMTAALARELVRFQREMEDIAKKIAEACERGDTHIWEVDLSARTIQRMIDLGYTHRREMVGVFTSNVFDWGDKFAKPTA